MVDYVLPSAIVRNALTGAGPDYRADPFVRELAEQCDINPVPRLPKFNAGAGVLRRFPDRLERSSASLKDGRDAQDDRICLWNTLAGFIPEIPFTPPGDRPVRVLDLACGKARGAVPLVEYFEGGSADSKGSAVEYTGVDIDPTAIKEAEGINKARPDFKFITADAADFENFMGSDEGSYDVILMRHPGSLTSSKYAAIWRKIAREAFSRLSPSGIIIVTTYMCHEHLYMKHIFETELNAIGYISGMNPYAWQTAPGHAYDNYVAIYGKRPVAR